MSVQVLYDYSSYVSPIERDINILKQEQRSHSALRGFPLQQPDFFNDFVGTISNLVRKIFEEIVTYKN